MAPTQEEKTTFGVTIVRPASPTHPAPALTTTSPSLTTTNLDTSISTAAAKSSIPLLHTTTHDSDTDSTAPNTPLSPAYDSANPFSPFYQHPESRSHLEVHRTISAAPSTSTPNPNRKSYDLEAQNGHLSPAVSRLDLPPSNGSYLTASKSATATATPTTEYLPALSTATTTAQSKTSVDGRVKECTVWPTKQTLAEKAAQKKRQRGNGCTCWRAMNRRQKLISKLLIGLVVIALAVGLSVGVSRAVGGGVWAGEGQSSTIPKDGP
ncbi:hypothetical protein K490DRAFT_69074 [Saccharata proteae CBS 121410]|uniref:Uncharacterized protein n=1 Tax=Saccharata proteae CBS 121410 TaxID=1314787 RepID=A0A9P4LVI7_9PEZI|nr:hypothetical protein K490DRAFT_69074 [Saccharata proteae CBS 121410]